MSGADMERSLIQQKSAHDTIEEVKETPVHTLASDKEEDCEVINIAEEEEITEGRRCY